MKIEKVAENMIKVTLCTNDMKKWNVTYERLNSNDSDVNDMFWDIIHQATEETGIEFVNCRLIVEAMQRDRDTFVMFITKKGLSERENKTKPVKYKYYRKNNQKNKNDLVLVYSFKGLEDVVDFAKNNLYYCFLFDGKNSLYRDKQWVKLVITLPQELKEQLPAFNDRICEYANISRGSNLYAAYLNEHIKPLIYKNALKTVFYKM